METSAVFDINSGKYSRYFTDELSRLSDKMKSIYNSNYSYIFNSGISANSTAIDILLNNSKDSVIIYPSDSYYENIETIKYKKQIHNLEIYEIDVLNIFQLYELLKIPKHKILLLESCMNPSGQIFDFSHICQIKQYNTSIIIDNTWLSGYVFNPLYCGADIVTESMTKYYTANTELAGCCVFNNNSYNKLFDDYIRFNGIHISPNVIRVINYYINSTSIRLNNISKLAVQTINYLLKNNITCIHPCLTNHPSYNNYYKYYNNFYCIGTFLIGFYHPEDQIKEMMDNLKIFEIKSSFCYSKTIINEKIYKLKNNNLNFIRLSLGFNDNIDNIIMGINELINTLNIIEKNLSWELMT